MSFKLKRNKVASRFRIPVKPRDGAFIDRTIKHYAEYIDELLKAEMIGVDGIVTAMENLLLESQMPSIAAAAYHRGRERFPGVDGAIVKWGYDPSDAIEIFYQTIDEIKEIGNKKLRAAAPELIKDIERCSDKEFMLIEYMEIRDVFARRITLPPGMSFEQCAEMHKQELDKLDIFLERDDDIIEIFV